MFIIVGLGNPGKKIEKTRHNAGFMIVDFFAKKNEFPDFVVSKQYTSLISQKNHAHILENVSMENNTINQEIILVKPQTFMNESGIAVKKLTRPYSLDPRPLLIVVHDDIDLPLGKIKFSKDSGAGGHKGVDSIIQHLGNNSFIRLKIGIANTKQKVKAEEVVLQKFTKEEKETLNEVIKKSAEALNYIIENGLEKTMNEYNR